MGTRAAAVGGEGREVTKVAERDNIDDSGVNEEDDEKNVDEPTDKVAASVKDGKDDEKSIDGENEKTDGSYIDEESDERT